MQFRDMLALFLFVVGLLVFAASVATNNVLTTLFSSILIITSEVLILDKIFRGK